MLKRSFVVCLLAAGLVPAQDDSGQTFRTGINVVVAPAVVTNRQGDFIDGLQPQDFQLTDNGKIQDIKVDVTYVPISLVVAIQANASAEPVLSKIRKIGPLFKGLLTGDQGEVAIMAFDHRLQVLQDFTSDTDKVEEAMQKLRPGSSSSRMTDAVVAASRMLNSRPKDRRRVLLLISETRDNGSEAKVREALTDLQFRNVSVYSVNINRAVTTLLAKPQPPRPSGIPATARPLPAGVPPTPQAAEQVYGNAGNSANVVPLFVEIFKQVKGIFVDNPVEVYTKFTGGRETSFVSQKDLERAVATIGDELHSEYLITYAPNNRQEGGFHEIVVSVNRPGLNVRTRPGYWVAAQN
ncbi:MAG: VWA domain-containing protein [Acidobacteriota bacterium]